jgi:D-alanyl-D-alanine carboxypeptidase
MVPPQSPSHAEDMTRRVRRFAIAVVGVLASATACGGAERTEPVTTVQSTTTGATTSPSTTSVPRSPTFDHQAVLDDERRSHGAPGALALVRDGDAEWSGVSGVADITGTELTASTRFRTGSVTKPIVALLVLDAVNRGELALEDVVSDLIPGELEPEPPTTVRMLLDHSSGIFNVGDEGDVAADIANLPDPAMRAEATELATRYLNGERVSIPDRLYVALADTHRRYFEPGTGHHYSNVNYQLAAMVLERVTGMPLAELLRRRLVEPLGLRHTTIAPADAGLPEMHGYKLDAGGSLLDVTDDFLALGNGGSGGVISTADELLTMMQAIVSGELLPEPLVADMKAPTVQSDQSYGLGLVTYYLSCGTFYGHGGAAAGTHSIAIVNDDGTAGVVIAINLRGEVDPNLLAPAESLLCDLR